MVAPAYLQSSTPNYQISSPSSFPPCFKGFTMSTKRARRSGPIFLQRTNDAGYLLSSTRDAIMLYEPALTKMRPRTRTVLAFTGVTFRLVPLTIDTAMVD